MTQRIPRRDPFAPKSSLQRRLERAGSHPAIAWFLINVGSRVDPWLMRVTAGRLNVAGLRSIVILHHTGAKSGLPRQTPLNYFSDGDDVILIASKGGAPENPAWLNNVCEHPEVELWVGSRGGKYRARVAGPEERPRLWQAAIRQYAGFGSYQRRTGGREIPVVICSPR